MRNRSEHNAPGQPRNGRNYQSVSSFDEIRPLIKPGPKQTKNPDPVIPKDDVSRPPFQNAPQDDVNPALLAATGNDDEMSRQQHQSAPGDDGLQGKWVQQIGTHKDAWNKLTGNESARSEGRAPKLAALVRERCAVTRDGADKQKTNFFEKY